MHLLSVLSYCVRVRIRWAFDAHTVSKRKLSNRSSNPRTVKELRRTKFAYCCFIAAKHSEQYTGLSLLGWKGTFASLPH